MAQVVMHIGFMKGNMKMKSVGKENWYVNNIQL